MSAPEGVPGPGGCLLDGPGPGGVSGPGGMSGPGVSGLGWLVGGVVFQHALRQIPPPPGQNS